MSHPGKLAGAVLILLFPIMAAGENISLNNLVMEIGNWSEVKTPICFSTPRDGWVFGSISAEAQQGDEISVSSIEGTPGFTVPLDMQQTEFMHWLPQGAYELRTVRPDLALQAVTIRAIPEMHFCRFPVSPKIPEFGVMDWDFLKRYVLPHINTIVGNPAPEIEACIDEWTGKGRKWIGYYGLPHHDDLTGPKAYEYWTNHVGFQDTRLSGLIADEFSGRQNQWYPAWIEGIKLLGAADVRKGHDFYGYCGGPGMYTRPQAREMVRTIFENDFYMAYERYHHEEPTLEKMHALMDRLLGTELQKWRETFPGCEKKMVMVLGLFAQGMGLNVRPDVDFKVHMDLQMQYLATHPAFKDIFGVHWWVADYADDELLKWLGALYRHYGIEGNTSLLSDRYGYVYELNHIQNPDFADGFKGWRVMPATIDSMNTGYMERYSQLQGRYWHRAEFPDEPAGNTYMSMKHSQKKPNRATQIIQDIKPGSLYSIKMISSDYNDISQGISKEKKLPLALEVADAEIIADKSFQTTYFCQAWEPFRDKPAWFNLHRVVFRARKEYAWLTITDWPGGIAPADNDIGTVMVNFIEVQPFFDPAG